jgi:hypothetical protein
MILEHAVLPVKEGQEGRRLLHHFYDPPSGPSGPGSPPSPAATPPPIRADHAIVRN